MKKTIASGFKLTALTLLGLTLSLGSCKKETGPAGAQGTAGKDGNANVKNSTIFINANEWIYAPGICKVTKLVPELTADIIDKGAVIVYSEGSGSGSWDALPTSSAQTNGLVLTYGYNMQVGKLNLEVTFNQNITLAAGTLTSSNFKLVLISGSARAANPNVDFSNYKEVEKIATAIVQ